MEMKNDYDYMLIHTPPFLVTYHREIYYVEYSAHELWNTGQLINMAFKKFIYFCIKATSRGFSCWPIWRSTEELTYPSKYDGTDTEDDAYANRNASGDGGGEAKPRDWEESSSEEIDTWDMMHLMPRKAYRVIKSFFSSHSLCCTTCIQL